LVQFKLGVCVCLAMLVSVGACSAQVIGDYSRLWPEKKFPPFSYADALAFDGDIAVVGCPVVSLSDTVPGNAYAFDMTTAEQLYRLEPENGHPDDRFGRSVAMGDGLVAVGAVGDDDIDYFAGAAYVFDAQTGQQLYKLYGSDIERNDLFGIAVEVGEGVIAVGTQRDDSSGISSGAVYLFDADTGDQIRKLIPDPSSPQDHFGYSLAIHDGLLIIGAPALSGINPSGYPDPGSVYVFDLHTGQRLHMIVPDDGEDRDNFGYSVAIDDDYLVIGAYFKLRLANYDVDGAVYVYERDTWSFLGKCHPKDHLDRLDEYLGVTVAVGDGIIVAGATGLSDLGRSAGGAVVFDAGTRQEIARLLPTDGAIDEAAAGRSLAMHAKTILMGSHLSVSAPGNRGGAYLFKMPCTADTNLDGTVDHTDYTAWLIAFFAGSYQCDQNNDGVCTPSDFTAWIANFNAGCD
jgi:hypothetical protein